MNINKILNQNGSRLIGPSSRDRRLWVMTLLSGIAVVSTMLVTANCKADPPWRKTNPPPTPPAAPDSVAPGTVAVDLTKAYDPHEFCKDVTQDQRIHVHLDFGRVFESQGNLEAALMEYQQALAACERKGIGRSHSTDEALAHRRIANTLDRLGRFAQAEVHYRKALHLSPRDPKIWNDAGYSYYLQGRWADAERALKTALRYAPEDERFTTNLGLILAASGRTKEAISLLSKYSGDATGHANLGFLLAATGQVELARQQYLQALALRPNLAWRARLVPARPRRPGGARCRLSESTRTPTRGFRCHSRIVLRKRRRCAQGLGNNQDSTPAPLRRQSADASSPHRALRPSHHPEPLVAVLLRSRYARSALHVSPSSVIARGRAALAGRSESWT